MLPLAAAVLMLGTVVPLSTTLSTPLSTPQSVHENLHQPELFNTTREGRFMSPAFLTTAVIGNAAVVAAGLYFLSGLQKRSSAQRSDSASWRSKPPLIDREAGDLLAPDPWEQPPAALMAQKLQAPPAPTTTEGSAALPPFGDTISFSQRYSSNSNTVANSNNKNININNYNNNSNSSINNNININNNNNNSDNSKNAELQPNSRKILTPYPYYRPSSTSGGVAVTDGPSTVLPTEQEPRTEEPELSYYDINTDYQDFEPQRITEDRLEAVQEAVKEAEDNKRVMKVEISNDLSNGNDIQTPVERSDTEVTEARKRLPSKHSRNTETTSTSSPSSQKLPQTIKSAARAKTTKPPQVSEDYNYEYYDSSMGKMTDLLKEAKQPPQSAKQELGTELNLPAPVELMEANTDDAANNNSLLILNLIDDIVHLNNLTAEGPEV